MLKAVGSVVAGYIVMFLLVFVTFSAAFMILGTEGAFKPGSFEPSLLWSLLSIVLGLLAAIAGGMTCARIARSAGPPKALAAFVLVLGLLMGVGVMMAEPEETARTGELSNQEAMMQAQQPLWMALLNPVIGAIGVMIGARVMRS